MVEKYRRAVGGWLLFLSGMVFTMILVGGLTRLTQSGLSMVEWRPLMGLIPPITSEDWNSVFEQYKAVGGLEVLPVGIADLNLQEVSRLAEAGMQ